MSAINSFLRCIAALETAAAERIDGPVRRRAEDPAVA